MKHLSNRANLRYIKFFLLLLVMVLMVGCTEAPPPDALRTSKLGMKPIELSLELPNVDYVAGKPYVARVILKSDNSRPVVSKAGESADLFEILTRDNSDRIIILEAATVETTTTYGSGVRAYNVSKSIRFTEPGIYRVSCRLKDAELPVKGWPNDSIELETDPIVITVR
ncbi:MAG: hypothetical protein Q8J63_05000 [Candidatus Aquicultor sp.]|nr:hypothetical protein [Candidatus Aquicultor sp.]